MESPLVMVVDDSEDIREIVKFVLNSQGYRVAEANDGREAVNLARTNSPDLILMDLSMPVLDGFGATRQLREMEEVCDVPIVALSCHNTPDHRAKALAVGFNDYLTKPVDFINLMELVRRLLKTT